LDWRRAGSAECRPSKTEAETGEAGRRADAGGRLDCGSEPRNTRHAGGWCASGEYSGREPGPREFSNHRRDEGSHRDGGSGNGFGDDSARGFTPGRHGASYGNDSIDGRGYGPTNGSPVNRFSITRDHDGH
jgi:hypothetical protein